MSVQARGVLLATAEMMSRDEQSPWLSRRRDLAGSERMNVQQRAIDAHAWRGEGRGDLEYSCSR